MLRITQEQQRCEFVWILSFTCSWQLYHIKKKDKSGGTYHCLVISKQKVLFSSCLEYFQSAMGSEKTFYSKEILTIWDSSIQLSSWYVKIKLFFLNCSTCNILFYPVLIYFIFIPNLNKYRVFRKIVFFHNPLQPIPRLHMYHCTRFGKVSTQCKCTVTPIGWPYWPISVQQIAA